MEDIVIVSAARTAVGKFGGSLAKVPATELGSIVIKAIIAIIGIAQHRNRRHRRSSPSSPSESSP